MAWAEGGSDPSDQHVHLTRGASYLIMQTLASNAIVVVAFIILARIITTKEMGIWAILQLVSATCVTFVTFSLPQAVTKFVAENTSKLRRRHAAAAFYQALRATVIISFPLSVGMYIGAPFLAVHLLGDVTYAALFQVLSADVFLYAGVIPVLTAALLGLRMFRETAVVGIAILGLVRQFLIILFIVWMRSFVGLVVGWVLSDAAAAVIYLALTVHVLGAPRFDFQFSELLDFSLPLQLANVASFAQSWFDRALLAVFVPLAALGIYNAALTAFGVLMGVAAALSNMLFPAYSSIQNAVKRSDSMSDSIRLATRYATLILTPLAFGLFGTARVSLALFVGESYIEGYLPLMIFCGAYALIAFTAALGPVLLALEETKLSAFITGITVLISFAAAYMLLPVWGIEGAATARAVAMILGGVLTFLLLRRKIALQMDFRGIGKIVLAGATMAAVLFVLQLMSFSKFALPFYILIGAVTYLVTLRLLKVTNSLDLDILRLLLGRRLIVVTKVLSWILVGDRS